MLILQIIYLIISIVLIVLILLQSKGVGLSAAFGGSDFHSSRRGAEKIFFIATIFLAVSFVALSILNLIY